MRYERPLRSGSEIDFHPDAPADAPQRKRLSTLQILRALAALAIVLNHSINQINPPGAILADEYFAFGVDVFFIISGFLMVRISDSRYNHPGTFLKERLQRIFPMYFLMTSGLALVIMLSPGAVRHS